MSEIVIEAACMVWNEPFGYRAKKPAMLTRSVDLAWDDRYHETLTVNTSMTAGEVMNAAAEALELTPVDDLSGDLYSDSNFVPCFADVDGAPYWLDAVLTRDGSVTWDFEGRDVSLDLLLSSYRQQVISGDPTKVIIFLDYPGAGEGEVTEIWNELVVMWPTIAAVLKGAGAAGSSIAAIRGGMKVFRSMRRKWRGRGSDLAKYSQLMKIPRTTNQVATLLSVSKRKAVAICLFFGLEEIDGSWRSTRRPDKQEVAELADVIDLLSQEYWQPEVWVVALKEILAEPVGERHKKAKPIIRRLEFEKHMKEFPESDPSDFIQ